MSPAKKKAVGRPKKVYKSPHDQDAEDNDLGALGEAARAIITDPDESVPIQRLYSSSPGLTLNVRPAPRWPIPVQDARTGMVKQVEMPSIKVKFTEDSFVPKLTSARGPATVLKYKEHRVCGMFDYAEWFEKHAKEYNLLPPDRADIWDNIVKGPGFGKNFGTLDMIESLLWGATPQHKASDKAVTIDVSGLVA